MARKLGLRANYVRVRIVRVLAFSLESPYRCWRVASGWLLKPHRSRRPPLAVGRFTRAIRDEKLSGSETGKNISTTDNRKRLERQGMDTERKAKVLVVEDERITARAIEKSLTDSGFDVVDSVSHGEQALERIAYMQPDVILMDIRLQGSLDGISTAQRAKALFDIPVIYLTAHSDDDTMKRVLHSKPYGCIIKPFEEAELIDAIGKALHLHRMKQRINNR
jgi:CheY-like chemotaxis protein